MKKTLSLVLATVLAFGGSVSAFAWPAATPATAAQLNSVRYKWDGDNGYFTTSTATSLLNYGTTFGFLITDGVNPATKAEHVKNIRTYPEYNMKESKNLVEATAVEYKKYATYAPAPAPAYAYAYFATIKTKANSTAASADLMGEMRIGTGTTDSKLAARNPVAFGVTLDNGKVSIGSSCIVSSSTKVLDFTNQGDVEITFAPTGGNDQASFSVDATGQSKLNLGFTTKFNSEFAAKYPEANLNFISWGAKPSFNRIGELKIYINSYSDDNEEAYLYQLTEDGFKEVAGKYDEDYEAFVIKTRTLGAYVVSDIELEAEVIDEVPVVPEVPGTNPGTGGVVEVPNNGGKPNPNTGR